MMHLRIRTKKISVLVFTLALTGSLQFFFACNPGGSSGEADSLMIAKGQTNFTMHCSACHNFRQDGIGPQLGGLAGVVSPDWIRNFIKDPKAIIESGDQRGQELYERYNNVMPSFGHLPADDINTIVAFINTQKAPDAADVDSGLTPIKNPIPEPIPMSDLVVDLELVTQIPESGKDGTSTRIVKLDYQPETDKLFILDLRGKLHYLHDNKSEVYFDLPPLMPKFIDKPGRATGFGSFAFHPEFAKNGLLYTTHSESPGSGTADFVYADSIKVAVQWVVSEWKTDNPAGFPFSGKNRELFRINMVTGIHGVQEITFNPLAKPGDADYGLLYIGIGDGGSAESGFMFITHNIEGIWGSIIRIDPRGGNSNNGRYGIPKQNPFVKSSNPKARPEIYAIGFRNPHRITWSRSGEILASNIGHNNIEALNIIEPGRDYGWPIREGTFVINPMGKMSNIFALPEDDKQNNFTYPVAQYDHDEGKAITGGYEYWGTAVPELKGKYVFGDLNNGRLFYVEMADLKLGSQATIYEWKAALNGKLTTMAELCGDKWVHLRCGRDSAGELYIFTKPDGRLYKLAKVNKVISQVSAGK